MSAYPLTPAAPDISFPALEEEQLRFWRERKIFEQSLAATKNGAPYLFYDGPPFATGLPHHGHLLAGTIKDIIPRYWTMRGRYVERRFGWDTHGLPVEMLVESELGLKGRADVLQFGIDKFNEACRSSVFRYVKEWRSTTERLGRWIDFDNDYKTLDRSFMESVWWVFSELWKRGRIYKGKRVMPYSWRLGTPLSNFEAGLNYQDVQDPAITVSFPLTHDPGCALLAWTTTPWTLMANRALCVHPELEYVEVEHEGKRYILAAPRLLAVFGKRPFIELRRFAGATLIGQRYEPLLTKEEGPAHQVLADPFVTADDGTGIVHLAPYGEDDYRILSREKISADDIIDAQGNFLPSIPHVAGLNFKEAEKPIIAFLKTSGRLFDHQTINHSYPLCYRSDTPLMYRPIDAWYVKVEDLREKMVAQNSQVTWVPEHMKEGRFGNWLSQARDWNISRNRFWGNPIPVWECDQCHRQECLGSAAELEAKSGKSVPDLHSHYIDPLTWQCGASCSGTMRRVPEVLDCWFESGSMPYAQQHYPFENKAAFERSFPADFIAEGTDQTRGWFYVLTVLGTSLFEKIPFKNVIVNGIVLAADGKKMSKRLKNYTDPNAIFAQFGADALRLTLINSPAVRADDLRLSDAAIKETVRQVLLPLWNVYSFFTTYAAVDRFEPRPDAPAPTHILDRWILSRLKTLLGKVEVEMESYRLFGVVPQILTFLEELTNWYLRRSRRRFWEEGGEDKQQAYETLFTVLLTVSKVTAPFLPFLSEAIFRNLRSLKPSEPESVHLCSFPRPATLNNFSEDAELERQMAFAIQATELGRALRSRLNLKTRQPLASMKLIVAGADASSIGRTEIAAMIKEELNVKEFFPLQDDGTLLDLTVKPNFPLLGPIFGAKMKEASKIIAALPPAEITTVEQGGTVTVLDQPISKSHVTIIRKGRAGVEIETNGVISVLFDTTLTPALIQEGLAREVVNRIQKMRKDADLHVADRITVTISGDGEVLAAVDAEREYIAGEVLAVSLARGATGGGSRTEEHDIEGKQITITIEKRNQP